MQKKKQTTLRKHVAPKKRGKRPVRHAKRRPAAHRPAAAERPVMHRVTYASPLCGERTQAINDLLGLDNLDQLAVDENGVVAAALPEDIQNVVFGPPDTAVTNPGTGGGTDNPGTPGTPGTPDFPGTPGSPGFPDTPIIVIPPVTPPDTGTTTPPVTPPDQPVTPPDQPVTPPVGVVPEPSSWATMLLGMGLIGVTIRRRRKKMAAA